MWSSILRAKVVIGVSVHSQSNNVLEWVTTSFKLATSNNLYNFFQPVALTNPYVIGVWDCKFSKIYITLWRL